MLLPLALEKWSISFAIRATGRYIVDATLDILCVGKGVILAGLPLLAFHAKAEVDKIVHFANGCRLVLKGSLDVDVLWHEEDVAHIISHIAADISRSLEWLPTRVQTGCWALPMSVTGSC